MSKHYTLEELIALEDSSNILPYLIPSVSTKRDGVIVHQWSPAYGNGDPVWDILNSRDIEALKTWEDLHKKEGRSFIYMLMNM